MKSRVWSPVVCIAAIALAMSSAPGYAHKQVTSPYTFAEDVAPILREHCGQCHVSGGAAPMSLWTHEETVPWADSMRAELVAGHMPPWGVEGNASRFVNVKPLTARELNVLLTWASGGTPPGTPAATPHSPAPVKRAWPLGEPDLALQPSQDAIVPADVQERVEEFMLATGTAEPRWLRAVDVLPGDPTVVRRATVSLAPDANVGASLEKVLALWLPGDPPVPATEGAGFLLPAGAHLTVRIHYRKTWRRERDVIRDRSTVGLYFTRSTSRRLDSITLEPGNSVRGAEPQGAFTFRRTVEEDVAALALYPGPDVYGATVEVRAMRPDGSQTTMIAFTPQKDWTRRYWFKDPIALPKGTTLDVRVRVDDEAALLPPGAVRLPPMEARRARVVLDVLAAR